MSSPFDEVKDEKEEEAEEDELSKMITPIATTQSDGRFF